MSVLIVSSSQFTGNSTVRWPFSALKLCCAAPLVGIGPIAGCKHLGSTKMSRSNLARINNSSKPYESLFGKLLTRCQSAVSGHPFRFKNQLYSLDASTIDLCLSMFPWADFRTTKGAVKLHVGLNHSGYLPEFVTITEGKSHDVTVGRMLKFPKGSIVVIDKGYNDYA